MYIHTKHTNIFTPFLCTSSCRPSPNDPRQAAHTWLGTNWPRMTAQMPHKPWQYIIIHFCKLYVKISKQHKYTYNRELFHPQIVGQWWNMCCLWGIDKDSLYYSIVFVTITFSRETTSTEPWYINDAPTKTAPRQEVVRAFHTHVHQSILLKDIGTCSSCSWSPAWAKAFSYRQWTSSCSWQQKPWLSTYRQKRRENGRT